MPTSEELFKACGSEKLPGFLQFETSNKCNASCLFCPKPIDMRIRPEMKWSQINRVIEALVPHAKTVCPFLMQEPALEPRLANILSYVKEVNPRCSTVIFSNMAAWSNGVVDDIVKQGNLDELVTSVYGYDEETHNRWQPGADWVKAWDGITLWSNARRRLKKTKPIIKAHYLAIPELMDGPGVKKYVDRITPLVDHFGFTSFDTFHGRVPDYGNNKLYFGEGNTRRVPCSRLWSQFNVLSNGDVVPCCLDYDDEQPLGSVFAEKPEEVWRGERWEALRRSHIEGRYGGICANCESYRREKPEWVKLFDV